MHERLATSQKQLSITRQEHCYSVFLHIQTVCCAKGRENIIKIKHKKDRFLNFSKEDKVVVIEIVLGKYNEIIECKKTDTITSVQEQNALKKCSGVMIHVSFFVVYLMGNVTDWRTAAGISAAVPIFTALYVSQMPETPIWLLSRGRYKDAERALCWLRGWVKPQDVKEEFMQLVEYNNNTNIVRINDPKQEEQPRKISTSNITGQENKAFESGEISQGQNSISTVTIAMAEEERKTHSCFDRWREMLKPPTLRPLGIVIPFFFFLQLGGMSSMRPFMVHVFQSLGLNEAASWATVGSAVIGICGSGFEVFTVHWLGKRFLTLLSMLGCAAACLLLAIYSFIVLRVEGDSELAMPWIPLVFFIALSFFNSIMFQIPWMLLSEVFPFRTRAIASGLSAAICYVFLFIASMTYLYLEEAVQLYGVFCIFCVVNIIGFIFLYWKMPVTEGKTLAEIEAYFTGHSGHSGILK